MVAGEVKCEGNSDRDIKNRSRIKVPTNNKTRGRAVHCEYKDTIPQDRGFSTEDILWAVGIWTVILTASPVVVFYMLMVA